MGQKLLNRQGVEDGFHMANIAGVLSKQKDVETRNSYRISTSEKSDVEGNEPYLGGVTDAVAGFLPLKSLMNARVTSILSEA